MWTEHYSFGVQASFADSVGTRCDGVGTRCDSSAGNLRLHMYVRLALLQHKGGCLHHAGAMKTARTPQRAVAKGLQRASKIRKVATSVLAIK